MANREIRKCKICGEYIKKEIYDAGYTIRSLAEEIGYSDRQVRTYIKQNLMPEEMYNNIFQKVHVRKTNELSPHDDFFDWLACAVVLESDWEENPAFYREVICRKLVKLGILSIEGDNYALKDPKNMEEQE